MGFRLLVALYLASKLGCPWKMIFSWPEIQKRLLSECFHMVNGGASGVSAAEEDDDVVVVDCPWATDNDTHRRRQAQISPHPGRRFSAKNMTLKINRQKGARSPHFFTYPIPQFFNSSITHLPNYPITHCPLTQSSAPAVSAFLLILPVSPLAVGR